MKALARWISIVGHPFVMALLMVFAAALRKGSPSAALRTALLVTVVALLPVAVLMFAQVRRGAWGNADASNRKERPLLFAVGMLGLAAVLAVQLVLHRGSFLARGMAGVLVMLGLCAVATRWIKVSLHLAFAALAATTLVSIGSAAGWVVLALLPALAWSRLALGRHRPAEVAIGLLIGAAFGYGITNL